MQGGVGVNVTHLSRPFFVRLQDRWNKHAFKPRRGVGPIAGQTEELLALLFSPSPGGPPKAISCVCVIFFTVDMLHPCIKRERYGLSATDVLQERSPAAMVAT
jgi:hypothetical protein